MAFITDREIAEIQKTLVTKEAANEVLSNFLQLLRNSFDNIPHSSVHNRRVDYISTKFLPNEFNNWKPLSSKADGNCLFH